jgi:DNA (cytosine-5)-methyltransferase 1
MKESGWLTRSLEQPVPYDLQYPGKITPKLLKKSFLIIVDAIEEKNIDPGIVLTSLLGLILEQMTRKAEAVKSIMETNTATDKPHIDIIKKALEAHFNYSYEIYAHGASRLPVLALEAVYCCFIKELEAYNGCSIITQRHTGPDKHTAGDIDIENNKGEKIESVEVKLGIKISLEILEDVKDKLNSHDDIKRYYILSTSGVDVNESIEISTNILNYYKTNSVEIIVNGVIPTIGYYLRLIKNPNSFINNYNELISNDEDIKSEHLEYWKIIQTKLLS